MKKLIEKGLQAVAVTAMLTGAPALAETPKSLVIQELRKSHQTDIDYLLKKLKPEDKKRFNGALNQVNKNNFQFVKQYLESTDLTPLETVIKIQEIIAEVATQNSQEIMKRVGELPEKPVFSEGREIQDVYKEAIDYIAYSLSKSEQKELRGLLNKTHKKSFNFMAECLVNTKFSAQEVLTRLRGIDAKYEKDYQAYLKEKNEVDYSEVFNAGVNGNFDEIFNNRTEDFQYELEGLKELEDLENTVDESIK